MSNLPLWKTVILASISSLIWNTILLFIGKELGANWHVITIYMKQYGQVITAVTILLILLFVGRSYLRKRKKENIQE
jgi:membrane protein DedA with SNARE-associated domain